MLMILRLHSETLKEGVDKLVDLYEITETMKRFNEILNEVGGSL